MYPIGDDSGAIGAALYATQLEDLNNLVNQVLMKVDGD
jgi:hypothetical protein